jgi:hypothetical protein
MSRRRRAAGYAGLGQSCTATASEEETGAARVRWHGRILYGPQRWIVRFVMGFSRAFLYFRPSLFKGVHFLSDSSSAFFDESFRFFIQKLMFCALRKNYCSPKLCSDFDGKPNWVHL